MKPKKLFQKDEYINIKIQKFGSFKMGSLKFKKQSWPKLTIILHTFFCLSIGILIHTPSLMPVIYPKSLFQTHIFVLDLINTTVEVILIMFYMLSTVMKEKNIMLIEKNIIILDNRFERLGMTVKKRKQQLWSVMKIILTTVLMWRILFRMEIEQISLQYIIFNMLMRFAEVMFFNYIMIFNNSIYALHMRTKIINEATRKLSSAYCFPEQIHQIVVLLQKQNNLIKNTGHNLIKLYQPFLLSFVVRIYVFTTIKIQFIYLSSSSDTYTLQNFYSIEVRNILSVLLIIIPFLVTCCLCTCTSNEVCITNLYLLITVNLVFIKKYIFSFVIVASRIYSDWY